MELSNWSNTGLHLQCNGNTGKMVKIAGLLCVNECGLRAECVRESVQIN